ncbi:hypothetical protein QJQ45_017288 [Haematococcus lacustris]|nr:hypothetical protein QJQ45_017288 [Haematococcus lacustris]
MAHAQLLLVLLATLVTASRATVATNDNVTAVFRVNALPLSTSPSICYQTLLNNGIEKFEIASRRPPDAARLHLTELACLRNVRVLIDGLPSSASGAALPANYRTVANIKVKFSTLGRTSFDDNAGSCGQGRSRLTFTVPAGQAFTVVVENYPLADRTGPVNVWCARHQRDIHRIDLRLRPCVDYSPSSSPYSLSLISTVATTDNVTAVFRVNALPLSPSTSICYQTLLNNELACLRNVSVLIDGLPSSASGVALPANYRTVANIKVKFSTLLRPHVVKAQQRLRSPYISCVTRCQLHCCLAAGSCSHPQMIDVGTGNSVWVPNVSTCSTSSSWSCDSGGDYTYQLAAAAFNRTITVTTCVDNVGAWDTYLFAFPTQGSSCPFCPVRHWLGGGCLKAVGVVCLSQCQSGHDMQQLQAH